MGLRALLRRGLRIDRRWRAVLAALLIAVTIMSCSACSTGYMARAAFEEARILWRRQPIEGMLAEPGRDDAQKRKLAMVLEAREFAKERLGLSVGGQFKSVSEIQQSAIVTLLVAARKDRLEPYTWWFPIVGSVPYKGFFSSKSATAAAKALEDEGYDAYTRTAIAFSTLGWFDDPLPSVLLKHDEVTLAEVMFHELLHATIFVPGEVTFDESLAMFVGYRSSIEFFCRRDPPDDLRCKQATDDWQDTLTIARFLSDALGRLEDFYATNPVGAALDTGRDRAFGEIRAQVQSLKLHPGRYADFAKGPINNASLLEQKVYLHELDSFEQLYRERGSVKASLDVLRKALRRGGDPFDRLKEILGDAKWDVAGSGAGRTGTP